MTGRQIPAMPSVMRSNGKTGIAGTDQEVNLPIRNLPPADDSRCSRNPQRESR